MKWGLCLWNMMLSGIECERMMEETMEVLMRLPDQTNRYDYLVEEDQMGLWIVKLLKMMNNPIQITYSGHSISYWKQHSVTRWSCCQANQQCWGSLTKWSTHWCCTETHIFCWTGTLWQPPYSDNYWCAWYVNHFFRHTRALTSYVSDIYVKCHQAHQP